MATSYIYRGLDQVKGPLQGSPAASPLHLFRVVVNVSGTYATGGAQVDVAAAFAGLTGAQLPLGARAGVTAINVLWAQACGDYNDGTNALTAATLTLSSGGSVSSISAASTNNLVLVKLFTGVNGVGGAELANTTAVNGDFGILVGVQLTYGANGVG